MEIDWRERYQDEHTPWDLGAVHPEIGARIARGEPGLVPHGSRRALVPGCGRGYDALALARAGWRVTATDLVAELGALLVPQLAELGGRFVAGDGLDFRDDEPFDLLLEHTFFCALPLERRAEYGALARAAVAPGGHLAALVFPLDRPPDKEGPPHAWDAAVMGDVLGPDFRLAADEAVQHEVERREWAERWAVFERV